MESSGNEKTPVLTGAGRVAVVALVLLGAGYGVMKAAIEFGRKAGEATTKRPVPDVELAVAAKGDITLELESQGIVQAVTETRAAAEVSGRIVKVSPAWEAGGRFAAGEELLKIDDADYSAALAGAEAAAAEAELAVKVEDERARQAVRDWNKLATGKPDSDLVTRGPQLQAARARLTAARAAVEKAKRDLDRTVIRAPYTGRMKATLADLGSFAAPAAPLAEFYSSEAYQVSLPLSLDDFALLAPDPELPVQLTGGPGDNTRLTGHLVRTAAEIDRASRSIQVIARILPGTNPPSLLVPGLFVRASLPGITMKNVIRLPRICLLPDSKVAIVSDNRLKTRKVRVARSTRDEVIISEGLEAGERVLATALAVITEDMEVNALASPAPAASPGTGPSKPAEQSAPAGKPPPVNHMLYVWSKLSAAKWEDAWEERFHGPLQTGLAITRLPGGKTIRVEVYCEKKSDAAKIAKEFGGQVRQLKQQNWAAKSAESLQPVMIRNSVIVTHSDTAAESMRQEFPDRRVICIPGEMAFGTGDHATTSTCLRILADYAAAKKRSGESWSLMDLGCGTGILAITAAALGASPADGFDYDPAAVRIANRNAKLNGVRGVNFTKDDVTQWRPARQYDVVAANIFFDVLTLSFQSIADAAKPGGLVIVSGILHEQADGCLAAGRRAGLKFEKPLRKGKWVTAVGRKP